MKWTIFIWFSQTRFLWKFFISRIRFYFLFVSTLWRIYWVECPGDKKLPSKQPYLVCFILPNLTSRIILIAVEVYIFTMLMNSPVDTYLNIEYGRYLHFMLRIIYYSRINAYNIFQRCVIKKFIFDKCLFYFIHFCFKFHNNEIYRYNGCFYYTGINLTSDVRMRVKCLCIPLITTLDCSLALRRSPLMWTVLHLIVSSDSRELKAYFWP